MLVQGPGALAEAVRAQGGLLVDRGPLDAVVLDTSGCDSVAALRVLYDALHPAVRLLGAGGRVLLLAAGVPPSPQAAACARAVEGFTRSLAKELGRRGATANCLYLEPGAALDAPLAFFCSERSAYVCGQALHWQAASATARPARRISVVTGAAGGIGAATVRRLAAEGDCVLCVDVPQADAALRALAAETSGEALPLDLTAPGAPAQLAQAVQRAGGADVLVHNAGITRDRSLGRMSAQEWDQVLDLNLRAILAIDAALDAAGALNAAAREICLASISGIAGNAGQANYAASKAGLVGYVAARGQQLAARGSTVNAVAPGFIETAMTHAIPFMVRTVGRRLNSLRQGGRPADVAEAIAFLARPEARGCNGQVLRVCGQSWLGA
ncbi:3-oxoacyl-ACP reductase [Ramlibacter sp. G-1-2-2]|uniref:3-oxoacyl-ACP reductase n=1 Tax=Ramlibacter agri TaxID=2728837 RepID=A0A848HCD2_9BURK|nr:3-oxoacyl-ACP reductase [Ramlibacter agri]